MNHGTRRSPELQELFVKMGELSESFRAYLARQELTAIPMEGEPEAGVDCPDMMLAVEDGGRLCVLVYQDGELRMTAFELETGRTVELKEKEREAA